MSNEFILIFVCARARAFEYVCVRVCGRVYGSVCVRANACARVYIFTFFHILGETQVVLFMFRV